MPINARCSGLEQERVVKSVRNDVNRMTNAEIANQAKSSSAVDQLFAIRTVLEAHGMENLPPALQEFIRLRVSFPDASIKELGERANPPLSKSAVYHRIRRIEQLAREAANRKRVAAPQADSPRRHPFAHQGQLN